MMPILEGLDGVQKMSETNNNEIYTTSDIGIAAYLQLKFIKLLFFLKNMFF